MSMFQKPSPQNLSEWLEIATKKLVSQARQRIWTEVASHYEEAVEAHLQSDLPIEAAQAAALAELGDAKAAARRFRRTHLTESEFRKVAGMLESYQPNMLVHVGGVYWLGLVLDHMRLGSTIAVTAMVGLFLFYETVAFVLSRRKSPRRVVQMETGGWLMFGSAYVCMYHTLPLHGWDGLLIPLMYLNTIGSILYYFRLSHKLGKEAGDWMGEAGAARNENPPKDPIAS